MEQLTPSAVGDSDVAIIGLAGRFPGAETVEALWQNLCHGVESISTFSDQELLAAGVDPARLENPHYVKASGVLSDVDRFDAFFFGYSPNEAALMDPQQRLFLECAWQALEDAGYDPERYKGLIGVYAGSGMNTYLYNNLQSDHGLLEAGAGYHVMVASDKDFLATKASYKLNLKGPSLTIQTACSTSLVAVHLACQSLRSGECDVALAGGVSVRVPQRAGYLYQEGIVLSPDGHCRAFDAQAGGTVIGSGVGVVVLKLLADALADGDRLLAVIKGSALNNDGALKAGYTAPSLEAQAAVIAEAQGVAGVTADTITYVEAHGTGTRIGDPIEIGALTRAFRASTNQKGLRPEPSSRGFGRAQSSPQAEGAQLEGFCAIGSVKTNIGHLDAAAGVAGLIKTVLALQHRQIPPSLNFETPNPRIDFETSPFYVNTSLCEWQTDGGPRRAGVSSFGIGGTNAHAVLEEAPPVEPSGPSRPWQLLVLSARTEAALNAATANLVQHLAQHPDLDPSASSGRSLADVAYTLQVGRKIFEHRRTLVCRDVEEAQAALGDRDPTRVLATLEEATERAVVFMFTGQGAQYVNMGLDLYQTEPTFRQTVDECCELLQPFLGLDLRAILYPDDEQVAAATQQLTQTALTQPALFVIEYALARLWMEWGGRPQAMIGHSIGEYTAACLAGVFSWQDALALVAARGRLMQQMPEGAMLGVPLPEREVLPLLGEELAVGVINGPAQCVVSGPTPAIEALQRRLTHTGVTCRRLHTSHAFHSAMMDPVLEPFTQRVSQVALHPPQIPFVSNVTGTWITASEATDPAYWARHLRHTVRFAEGLQRLMEDPAPILLEVGPGRTLTTLATRHPAKARDQVTLPSLRHPQDRGSDVAFLLTTLGKLWLSGVEVDWAGFYAHERRLRLPLPTYPFERQRYWIEPRPRARDVRQPERREARKPDLADWFYLPSWKRSVASAYRLGGDLARSPWLVFADAGGLGARLVERLKQAGQDVSVAQAGTAFAKLDGDTYTLHPAQADDYAALFSELDAQGKSPRAIVHLWNVTPTGGVGSRLEQLDRTQELGFYSLLFLAQALGKQNVTDEVRITVVSNGAQEVDGQEALCPEKATLLGPVTIIPHEYPNLRCQSVDVTWPPAESGPDDRLVDQLVAEITAAASDWVVAYRGPFRWVQTFEPIRLEKPKAARPRLRQGGVYLITGGLGGMGLTLAKHLAQTVEARLILLDRSAFPPANDSTYGEDDPISRKMRQVQELEALGAEVLVVAAQVTDLGQMKAALAQAQERFGRINGVIHAAGVPGGGMIQLKTRPAAGSVLAPKVRGSLVLDAVLQEVPLDFLVLCSSVNSVVGRVGQVDYSAANAFLDAFVHEKNAAAARPTFCINWDTWREVGMAARMAQQSATSAGEIAHPLLDRCIVESETHDVYVTDFAVSKHWTLHEHAILGRPTLPGTTYLEMARAAFEARSGDGAVEIREAYFFTPLIVEEGEERQARTVLRKKEDGFAFSVMSRAGDTWQEHARGTIAALAAATPTRRALSEIESRCSEQEIVHPLAQSRLGSFDLQRRTILRGASLQDQPLTVDALVIAERDSASQARAMEFGPRWHSLQWVKLGAQEGLALLELPEAFETDLQSYKLHPALLDFATSFLRLFKSQGSYLPLSYKRLQMKGPLPRRVYSYVRFVDADTAQGVTLRFDVTLLDEQGTELVEIEEFAVMRIDDVGKLGALSKASAPAPDAGGLDARAELLAEDLRQGLSSAEGVEVFERVLESALPRVVVSTRDLPARIARSRARSAALLAQVPETVAKPKHPRPKLMNAYAPPRNEMEQRLAQIWQDVLGIEQVGVHDNFFELGGDSLLITHVHSRFVESFERDMSVANLLQYPTIADLAQFLGQQDQIELPSFEEVHQRTGRQKEAMRRRKQKMMQKRRAT